LTSEVRANELRAIAKYRDERVLISGRIQEVGVHKVTQVVGTQQGMYGWGLYSSEVSVSEQRVPYPYVMLAGPDQTHRDAAICYFAIEHTATVAELKRGSSVTLECEVQSFHVEGNDVFPVLRVCTLK
jgi:hypothetical protein